ncbi:MAG TPA: hypothetical protein VFG44_00305 [Burkholderiales bacterium]|nr:hypothetical protein [Burkholderiales bacterium]
MLENAKDQIVGIEVKAAATVTRRDFSGLDRLASVAGKHFVQGIVLYNGEQPLSFADNLRAARFEFRLGRRSGTIRQYELRHGCLFHRLSP